MATGNEANPVLFRHRVHSAQMAIATNAWLFRRPVACSAAFDLLLFYPAQNFDRGSDWVLGVSDSVSGVERRNEFESV